jgi:pyruvate/2-oxoglutarate dehydrogenase complex dihydrolipoamide dehydrogenase (E3) component
VKVVIEQRGKEKTIGGSHLLIAAGRMPNTEGIGLELAGVKLTANGYIQVDEHLATTAPGVWAIGEVAGRPQFTQVSADDFRVVHASITGGKRVTTGRLVPFCVFTDPEFARVGLSEKEAKEKGVTYRLFKIPMEAVMRATTMVETRGFMKALIAADGDRILGFTAVGVGAGEVLGTVQVAMLAGLPYTSLRDAILTHPTLVEGLIPLFSGEAEMTSPPQQALENSSGAGDSLRSKAAKVN